MEYKNKRFFFNKFNMPVGPFGPGVKPVNSVQVDPVKKAGQPTSSTPTPSNNHGPRFYWKKTETDFNNICYIYLFFLKL